MAKLTEKYESILVIAAELSEEAQRELIDRFANLIKENGTLESVDEWGKRRLAYPINHKNDGIYTLYKFECKPDFPSELERVYGITDGVIRFLVTKQV
jgi:ribosomal protein S6